MGNVLDMDIVKIDEPNEDGEGEILVKGPNVMLGYYKDEEANREAFAEDGFFKTGDYGYVDDEGKWDRVPTKIEIDEVLSTKIQRDPTTSVKPDKGGNN